MKLNIDEAMEKRKEVLDRLVRTQRGIIGVVIGLSNENPRSIIVKDRKCSYHCVDIEDVKVIE